MHASKPVLRDCMHAQGSNVSCSMRCSETQPEYDTTAPAPRRGVLAFSLARQPRRSARVSPEHARWPSLARLRPPSCPPHLPPQGTSRRPQRPRLWVKAHVRAPLAARRRLPRRRVPLQPGGQLVDGAVPLRLWPLPARWHGLRVDARRDALRLRGP
jgi:hypothetical protein